MSDELTVIVEEYLSHESTERRMLPGIPARSVLKAVSIDSVVLRDNLRAVLNTVGKILDEQPKVIGGFEINEVELAFSVNASGGIELVGKATAGAESGIRIKLFCLS
jgi:hypothetical protein